MAYDDDQTYRVLLIGSATAVRFRGREILLATQHQLNGFDETRVGMLTDSGAYFITSGGLRAYSPRPDTDAFDIAAFDFTEPCKERPELKKRFFNLTVGPPNVPSDHILGVLLNGYPAIDQKYELHEGNHLGLARRQIICLPHGQPTDQALLAVRPERSLGANSDGMSGGSAFVIQLEHQVPRAFFAGIIVRGGANAFYILKAGYVLAFLESVFPERPE